MIAKQQKNNQVSKNIYFYFYMKPKKIVCVHYKRFTGFIFDYYPTAARLSFCGILETNSILLHLFVFAHLLEYLK